MIAIADLIVRSASSGIALQSPDGSFAGGRNGPWDIEETFVRNTCHWAIQFARAYELTADSKFLTALKKGIDCLASSEARPFGFSFHIMKGKGWETNGIVGQAWVIETLLAGYRILKQERLLEIAEDLAAKHAFDKSLGIWRRLGLGGRLEAEHTTLNQQLWFWAMASQVAELRRNHALSEACSLFESNLPKILRFDGSYLHMLINERIYLPGRPSSFLIQKYRILKSAGHFALLSKGYVTYSLYPLAVVYKKNSSLPLWKNKKILNVIGKCISFLEKEVFYYGAADNPYAFSYHPTGFEAAVISEAFLPLKKPALSIQDWVGKQVRQHFEFKDNLMNKGSCDPVTFAARAYELYQLREVDTGISF